jgi:Protein of unknown function (DUF3499)
MTAPSWSRYGSRLRRLCARAGCNSPAVATLRFEPTERLAWLAELDESAARTQGDLCQRHAAALVLPRGWQLLDERASAKPAPEAVEAVESETIDSEVGEPEVFEASDETGEPDDATDGGAPRSAPAQFGSNDDDTVVEEELDTILDARTPLLQRAFRNARPN